MGPLSAIELYYGQKLNAGWSMFFLLASQMIGYGFAGLFRDILVRPPQMYYPGVLPNVSLFNAMHKNPSVTKKALKYFAIVASVTFVYEWLPELIFPLLGSLPLICWFGHGNWKAFVLGSGTYGFVRLPLVNPTSLANYQNRACWICHSIGTISPSCLHTIPRFGRV